MVFIIVKSLLLFLCRSSRKKIIYQWNRLIASPVHVLKQQSGAILFRCFDKVAHVTHCLQKVQLPAQWWWRFKSVKYSLNSCVGGGATFISLEHSSIIRIWTKQNEASFRHFYVHSALLPSNFVAQLSSVVNSVLLLSWHNHFISEKFINSYTECVCL